MGHFAVPAVESDTRNPDTRRASFWSISAIRSLEQLSGGINDGARRLFLYDRSGNEILYHPQMNDSGCAGEQWTGSRLFDGNHEEVFAGKADGDG